MVLKRVQFRIYPNKKQQIQIEKTLGCSRFVYNKFLEYCNTQYSQNGISVNYSMMSAVLTFMKRNANMSFLNEADSIALQQSLRDLDTARKNFFKFHRGFPKFKSKKKHHASYRTGMNCKQDRLEKNRFKIPKVGYVKAKISCHVENIKSFTVKRTASGKYFVSVLYETEPRVLSVTSDNVGIDVGLKEFLTDSNGNKVLNPRFYEKALKHLAAKQRKLSRKNKNSKNYEKQRVRVARCHERVLNARRDFLHKLSSSYIYDNQVICVEDLAVKNMLRNDKLSKSISSVSWGMFLDMLEYKSLWYNRTLVTVPRFYPSSQLCFICGFRNPDVRDLKIRQWTCPQCYITHDRDVNAAKNIL